MLLITCPQIKHKKSPLLLVFFEQILGIAWALAMSITLLTKTNPQPSVWQPLHWTPSKNAPSSEYFGRFAPIYDKIGTRNALSLEACISIQRSKQEMLRQEFVTYNSSDLQKVSINVTSSIAYVSGHYFLVETVWKFPKKMGLLNCFVTVFLCFCHSCCCSWGLRCWSR